MPTTVLKRAADLTVAERAAFESLLGRSIAPDEEISVSAFDRGARRKAAEALLDTIAKLGASTDLQDEEELGRLLDEACDEVRYGSAS